MAPSPDAESTGYEWKKTSVPLSHIDTSKGNGGLGSTSKKTTHTTETSQRGSTEVGPSCYNSREEVLAGSEAFRVSWEFSHRGHPFNPSNKHLLRSAFAASETTLPAGKSINSLGVLSAVQERQFKRQRRAGSDAIRAQFATQQMATSREKRLVQRGLSRRETKFRKAFDKRGAYLGTRINDLTTTLDATAQHIRRLKTALDTHQLAGLLVPLLPSPGEGADDSTRAGAEEGERKEELSYAQQNQLYHRAYVSMVVLEEEQKRDAKQLELMQGAKKVLSGCEYATEAEVKEADAKRSELLNEAALVRRDASLPRIAAKVLHTDRQSVFKASTGLRWLNDFRKQGGFRLE